LSERGTGGAAEVLPSAAAAGGRFGEEGAKAFVLGWPAGMWLPASFI
jgi:hypothetical protein